MVKKTLVILLILCLPMSGIALADSGSSGPGYFLSETAVIIADIVLFPFRLIRDIFDPQPLPPRPVLMPYSYAAPMVMVAPPIVPAASPVVAQNAPSQSVPANNPMEINIPNGDGSYISITLQKTEKGFLGPQGEFYADHPTEEQLKTRYCKK
jgi:hypothetical protein